MAMRFSADWVEHLELRGGERIRLRPIRPEDKAKIQAGLQHLSPESQYLRFFTAKPRLSERELAYFTEVDGWNHFALGAVRVEGEVEGDGVGIGRFVRLPEDAVVAEPAIVVADELQRQGLGRILLERLVAAAREREIQTFRSEFLATNTPVKHLLQSIRPQTQFTHDGTVVTAEFPLAENTATEAMHPWLKLVAAAMLDVRRRFRD